MASTWHLQLLIKSVELKSQKWFSSSRKIRAKVKAASYWEQCTTSSHTESFPVNVLYHLHPVSIDTPLVVELLTANNKLLATAELPLKEFPIGKHCPRSVKLISDGVIEGVASCDMILSTKSHVPYPVESIATPVHHMEQPLTVKLKLHTPSRLVASPTLIRAINTSIKDVLTPLADTGPLVFPTVTCVAEKRAVIAEIAFDGDSAGMSRALCGLLNSISCGSLDRALETNLPDDVLTVHPIDETIGDPTATEKTLQLEKENESLKSEIKRLREALSNAIPVAPSGSPQRADGTIGTMSVARNPLSLTVNSSGVPRWRGVSQRPLTSPTFNTEAWSTSAMSSFGSRCDVILNTSRSQKLPPPSTNFSVYHSIQLTFGELIDIKNRFSHASRGLPFLNLDSVKRLLNATTRTVITDKEALSILNAMDVNLNGQLDWWEYFGFEVFIKDSPGDRNHLMRSLAGKVNEQFYDFLVFCTLTNHAKHVFPFRAVKWEELFGAAQHWENIANIVPCTARS